MTEQHLNCKIKSHATKQVLVTISNKNSYYKQKCRWYIYIVKIDNIHWLIILFKKN